MNLLSIWKNIKCVKIGCDEAIGASNNRLILIGNVLVSQSKTNIVCPTCGRTKTFKMKIRDAEFVRILSEKQVNVVLGLID